MRILRVAGIAVVAGLLLVDVANGETLGSGTNRPSGWQTLPAGEQRIARALFEAQTPSMMPASADATPLTLDEIAALRVGRSWDAVLKEMRAKHLIQAASLPEVIARYERPSRGNGDGSGIVAVTTAGGRTSIVGTTHGTHGDAP